ncbi:regulatory protein ToxS [Vibrio sp. SCSIO 43137]|uniref:regulatory protein ToxS n=1 Tax=Vibrio sp. SCSIO 43137 TaxID=3021011 RepID=UPI002307640F|nr:regulatory protein ToxS [Vibrio sp. SCSIO 43137]WCE31570.1 regulatory protein ToxS [Vibrio sp. SCSIO 43137]
MKLLRIIAALMIITVSGLFFLHSDFYQSSKISSSIWINENRVLLSEKDKLPKESKIPPVQEVRSTSNTKFLSNGFYIRQSKVRAFTSEADPLLSLDIQDRGRWQIEDGFLLMEVESIENTGLPDGLTPLATEAEFLKSIYFNKMKKAKKISYITDKIILLTALNQQNEVMVAK